MASKKFSTQEGSISSKVKNKLKRQELFISGKKAKDSAKRDERFRRKREEDKDPRLKQQRVTRNQPATLERKRVWDEVDGGSGAAGLLGRSIDAKRLKQEERGEDKDAAHQSDEESRQDASGDELDSMLGSDSEVENEGGEANPSDRRKASKNHHDHEDTKRGQSPAASTTSSSLDLTPETLAAKFPRLFSSDTPVPKVLVTTSLNSTLHHEAELLTSLFPNSVYIPRSAHRYGHKFSVREIAKFATHRKYTTLIVLKEDQKRPTGLMIVHLPQGPSFHFTVNNWVEGKKLPSHGNPTDHNPELILNNFRTPLGLLTAQLFQNLFPPQPDLIGRQVVTLHNQRDYIFVRRHRYVFRNKRPTEKSVVGSDGKDMKGAEQVRAGLQELGPRFTLKLRRVDKGIGRAGSDGPSEWEWKGRMEKQRTKFQI